jgi:glucans biosynthesis protein C
MSMLSSSTPITNRQYFLDWLRILAFAALVIFHVGMYYVTWDFHVKSPLAGHSLEIWMKLTEPWRMSLLFVISGAATANLLKSGPIGALVRSRSRRLLLPLLCGVVLIVPPQSYYEVVQKFAYAGSYIDFLRLYFSHYQGFCKDTRCLILPTWNHLWFLPYLWIYTIMISGILALWPTTLQRAGRWIDRLMQGYVLWLLPIVVLCAIRLALFQRYPATHALWGDWFSHAIYFSMFTIGTAFAASHEIWERLDQQRWLGLILAFIFWAVMVFIRPAKPLAHVVVAMFQWAALIAALGFAKRHLNHDARLRERLTEAVFPVYLVHQTIIIVTSQWLLPLQWSMGIEGPVLIAITVVMSYAIYEGVRRLRFIRPWFGLKNPPSIKAATRSS